MDREPKYKVAHLYGNTIDVQFSQGNHRYYINGKPATITTSGVFSSLGDPMPLVRWKINKAIDEQSDRIIQALKKGQTIDDIFIAGIKQIAKEKPEVIKEEAADEGTLTHEKFEEWITNGLKANGGEFPIDKKALDNLHAIMGARPQDLHLSIDQFGQWLIENKAVFTFSEKIIYSKKHDYPGTADCGLIIKPKNRLIRILGDFKVRSGVYNETRLQTAAYMHADQEESGIKYDYRMVFLFGRKDGKFTGEFKAIQHDNFKVDFKAFINALELALWLKKINKSE